MYEQNVWKVKKSLQYPISNCLLLLNWGILCQELDHLFPVFDKVLAHNSQRAEIKSSFLDTLEIKRKMSNLGQVIETLGPKAKITLASSSVNSIQWCFRAGSNRTNRKRRTLQKSMGPKTLPFRLCSNELKENSSKRKGYCSPCSVNSHPSRRTIRSFGHPEQHTMLGVVEMQERSLLMRVISPAGKVVALPTLANSTLHKVSPFQNRTERYWKDPRQQNSKL